MVTLPGDLGTNTSINKISNISLTTEGASLVWDRLKQNKLKILLFLEKSFQQSVLEILKLKKRFKILQ